MVRCNPIYIVLLLLLQYAHVQIVNELYGSTIYLCYKKAGASLAVIQQVAEKTAEKTAKQVSTSVQITNTLAHTNVSLT